MTRASAAPGRQVHDLVGKFTPDERIDFLRTGLVQLTFPQRLRLLENTVDYLLKHTDDEQSAETHILQP